MRTDQYIGLNKWATAMLHADEGPVTVVTTKIPREGEPKTTVETIYEPSCEITPIGTIQGAWNDSVGNLWRYDFPDGRLYTEYVQAEPWSSGPMYFIALKDADGDPVPESLWTDEEMGQF